MKLLKGLFKCKKSKLQGQRAKVAIDPDHIYSIPNEVTEDIIKPFDVENDPDPVKYLTELVEKVKCHYNPGPYYFFTAGTGVPDKSAIKYFKDNSDVIVVDRKQRMWRKGKRYRELIKEKTNES